MRILIVILVLLANTKIASSAIVVGITGTVVDGNLNGVDLAGAEFIYGGLVSDVTDIDDTISDIGTFKVENAFLDFGNRGVFDFGADAGYFSWGLARGSNNDTFYIGAMLSVDTTTSPFAYDNGFRMLDQATTLQGFDPDSLTEFGPFSDFDSGGLFNGSDTFFAATNGLGDSIRLNQIGNSGSLVVTAVPEPSTLAALLGFLPAFLLRRSRKACSSRSLRMNTEVPN